MTHTPGPWKARYFPKQKFWEVRTEEGNISITGWGRVTQSAANARLIAAAPELYDLLNEWLDTPFFETKEEWQKWVDDYKPRVLQAVIKAGGDA